jgi:hypothetical protein
MEIVYQVRSRLKGNDTWTTQSEHGNPDDAIGAMYNERNYFSERVPHPVELQAVKIIQSVEVLEETVS